MMIGKFRLTRHAGERMLEMGLQPADVWNVLHNWKNRYEQSAYGPGRVMYQLDGLAVGTAEPEGEAPAIVTVLWNEKEQWAR